MSASKTVALETSSRECSPDLRAPPACPPPPRSSLDAWMTIFLPRLMHRPQPTAPPLKGRAPRHHGEQARSTEVEAPEVCHGLVDAFDRARSLATAESFARGRDAALA